MDAPFLGSIVMFAGNFAPRGWALCQGQILPIAQNTALFSILGTTYGGNGQTTFALPDLRGRVPVGYGQGPGLSSYQLGQQSGSETVQLTITEMPAHNHLVSVNNAVATLPNPANGFLAESNGNFGGDTVIVNTYASTPNATLAPASLSPSGGSQPHPNLQPYLCINFIIALEGIYPSRS